MDEDRVVIAFSRQGKLTAEFIVKSLLFAVGKVADKVSFVWQSRVFTSETNWNKFVNRLNGKIDIKTLDTTQVNLEAFKKELKEYGIGFAFKEKSDGIVEMAYAFKHEKIVERGLENVIQKIVDKPEDFVNKVKETSKNMPLPDKLKYYDAIAKDKIEMKLQIKTEAAHFKNPELSQKVDVLLDKVKRGKSL